MFPRDSNGEVVVPSEYKPSSVTHYKTHPAFHLRAWEAEYWPKATEFSHGKKHQELAFPCMYKGKPCWRGQTVQPDNFIKHYQPVEEFDWDRGMFIMSMKGKFYFVDPENVRMPTDREYYKFFKLAVDNFKFIIKIKPGSAAQQIIRI